MKPRHNVLLVLTAALLVTVLAGAAPLAAQSSLPSDSRPAPRLVATTGEAEILVAPDEVLVTLGVETSDVDLSKAKQLNDERVAKIIAAAKALGVEEKYLQTDHISIEPRYRDSYEQRDFIGFFVRQTIAVTLKDITAFDALLTDVLEAGATHVHGIQFRTSELRKHRDEARAEAIRAAQEKAAALAAELGETIGKPHEIREEQANWYSSYGSWWGGGAYMMTQNVMLDRGSGSVEGGSLAPGQISITARVSVSFELQ
jgi:hypothetical protein